MHLRKFFRWIDKKSKAVTLSHILSYQQNFCPFSCFTSCQCELVLMFVFHSNAITLFKELVYSFLLKSTLMLWPLWASNPQAFYHNFGFLVALELLLHDFCLILDEVIDTQASVASEVRNLVGHIPSHFFGLERQIFVIFQDLGKSCTGLGYCSVLGRKLDRVKNGFAGQWILSEDLKSSRKN